MLLPLATALQTNSPQPELRILYDQADAPVVIKQAYIAFSSGYKLPIIPQSNPGPTQGYEYTVKVNHYLLPGQYVLYVEAEDNEQNINIYQQSFNVTQPEKLIWVRAPIVPYLNRQTQDFAIGKKADFTIELETFVDATCRIRHYDENLLATNTPKTVYDTLGYNYFNNDNTASSITHRIQGTATNLSNQQKLPFPREIDYTQLERHRFLVVCKTTTAGKEDYFLDSFYLGYDTSSPQLTYAFSPSLIQEETAVQTTLTLNSSDAVWCSYTHTKNPNGYQADSSGNLLNPSAITSLRDFSQFFNKSFSFIGKNIPLNQQSNFDVQLTCQNPALQTTVQTKTYSVNLNRNLLISLEKTAYSSTTPKLTFTTNLLATCQATVSQTTSLITPIPPSRIHEITLQRLAEGNHQITVACEGTVLGVSSTQTFEFTIDTTPPKPPQFTVPEQSCAVPALSININDSEEFVRYNISISIGPNKTSEVLYPEQFTKTKTTYTYTLAQTKNLSNQLLTWAIQAQDQGGLVSTAITATTQLTEYNPLVCDTTAPKTDVTIIEKNEQHEIVVTCEDKESGCENSYSYAIVSGNQTCPDTYRDSALLNSTVISTQEGVFCYHVRNKAGLSTTDEEVLGTLFIIRLQTPATGIAPEPVFDLNVRTSQSAICRNGPSNTLAAKDSLSSQFRDLKPFDTTRENTHTTLINVTEIPFFTESITQLSWTTICKVGDEYYAKEFTLGYQPPLVEPEPECLFTSDCPIGYFCNERNNCEEESQPIIITEEPQWLAWILIVLGILLLGGGSLYLGYYERHKQQPQPYQPLPSQELSSQQVEAQRRRAEHLAELRAKQKEAEEKSLQDHLDARKAERRSLLSQFDTKPELTTLPLKKTPSTMVNETVPVKENKPFTSSVPETTTSTEYIPVEDLLDHQNKVSAFAQLAAITKANQQLTQEQVVRILEQPDVAHDSKKLTTLLQELIDTQQIDLSQANNALQELIKQGSITLQDLPVLMKRLRPKR